MYDILTPAFFALQNYTDINRLLIYCLLNANDSKALFKSANEISKATGLSPRKIRTCVDKLVEAGEIKLETTSQHHFIIVLKYGNYIKKSANNDKHSPYFFECKCRTCLKLKYRYDLRKLEGLQC